MKEIIKKVLTQLPANDRNHFIYYAGRKRIVRRFSEFAQDVDQTLLKIRHIVDQLPAGNTDFVAIIGPTSYQWLCIEYACLKGGHCLLAIPESLDVSEINKIIKQYNPGLVLVDVQLEQTHVQGNKWTYGGDGGGKQHFDLLTVSEDAQLPPVNILDQWSVGFSSGTSGSLKHIPLRWHKVREQPPLRGPKAWIKLYNYKRSLWSRKDNLMLLFLPLSHTQQRSFVRMAIMRRINILITTPENAYLRLISDKPNIVIGVPLFFESLAKQIAAQLASFNAVQRFFHWIYLCLGIPALEEWHPVKRIFQKTLFAKVSKMYGGRGSYFVTGSASISAGALAAFYKAGVKIREGYGQSELGVISMNTGRHYRLGSVGKPVSEVCISDHGEILVKFDSGVHDRSILNVDENGYIHTNDAGYMDKDGYLYVIGRMDDVIVLGNGKKVYPETLERRMREDKRITSVCVYAKDGLELSAIIHWQGAPAAEAGLFLRRFNRQLAAHERINTFVLIPEPFSQANGLLTGNMKPRRREIIKTYGSDPVVFVKMEYSPVE